MLIKRLLDVRCAASRVMEWIRADQGGCRRPRRLPARYCFFGGEREMPMHLASYCRCSETRRDDGLFRRASAAASRFNSSSSWAHTDEPRGSAGAPSGIASGLAPRAHGESVYVVRPEASWHL